MCAGWLLVGRAQLLDRVVARVAGSAITQSDVEAALGLGLIEADGKDVLAQGTERTVERRLMLAEVARFPPPEPSDAAINDQMAKMKARAGAGYAQFVQAKGLDEQRVRDLARDTLRIQAYLDQRFGASAQVSPQEARDYFEAHQQEFARNGVVPAFEEVEAAARQAVSAERRRASVARWLDDLRARGDVVLLTPRP
jgi:hypothetical protein